MLSKTELWDIFTGAKKPGMREGEADDAGLRAVAEAAVKDERGAEYSEACALAMAIYKRRYMTQSPQFELCPDTVGVITQIDNMVAGLFSDIEAAAQAERHRIYAALEADPGALWRDQGFQEWRRNREVS